MGSGYRPAGHVFDRFDECVVSWSPRRGWVTHPRFSSRTHRHQGGAVVPGDEAAAVWGAGGTGATDRAGGADMSSELVAEDRRMRVASKPAADSAG